MLVPTSKNFTKLLPSAILAFSYLFSFLIFFDRRKTTTLSSLLYLDRIRCVYTSFINPLYIYQQKISWQMVIGLFLIATGVVIVNIYKT